MLIFVGSSTARKQKAAYIANQLQADGHAVLCWWQQFKAGDYTLDRLIDLSRHCDGAVFVFGQDDKLWFSGATRSGGAPAKPVCVDAPRDNVILEYGMFVGRQGRRRVAIVVEGKVKLPTDLAGVTYVTTDKRYIEKLRDRFRDAPGDLRGPSTGLQILVTSREGATRPVNEIPKQWATRSLYVGADGANAWRSVELDRQYFVKRGRAQVTQKLNKMVRKHACDHDTVVSFGPGVASVDMKLLPLLPCPTPKKYIPVDIHLYLLGMAAANVDGADPHTSVPFAICGDFEEGMNDIGLLLEGHVTGRRLFLMLGGTFGNIESRETEFLGGLKNCMRRGDLFLLDTFVKGTNYSDEDDSFRQLISQPESVRRFFFAGLRRKGRDTTGRPEDYIDTDGIDSDVHGTSGFTFVTKDDARDPLCYVRRYDFDALAAFLRDDLRYDVLESGAVETANKVVNRGLFLLRHA